MAEDLVEVLERFNLSDRELAGTVLDSQDMQVL